MKRIMALAAMLPALAAAAAEPPFKGDAAKGQAVANQICAACHGADGNSQIAVNPKLAGQIPEYLHKQLVNFKAAAGKKAERDNPLMAGMVASLSPEAMRNLAAYYAGQTAKPGTAKSKDLVALGQKIYRGGVAGKGVAACASCHGPNGAGMPAQYPRLAGQHAEYTETQLKAFRAGERANDPNNAMRGVAGKLSDREIQGVSDYIAGLR
ncbi:MAG: cytochrome C [Betaproteobacteria bacterium RIFCSPLOWO2_12_FULL_62_13b]|nr:MAG: cytochrome C [Betaproteobacteria bacterium RIFCSPLOWO2_12_FULL_62_13b]